MTAARMDCRDTRAEKGQTVWHCFGESPAQQRANEKERELIAREALRAHVDGVPAPAEIGRTRILFADHDGRNDAGTITATQVFDGGRWFAHSSTVVGLAECLLAALFRSSLCGLFGRANSRAYADADAGGAVAIRGQRRAARGVRPTGSPVPQKDVRYTGSSPPGPAATYSHWSIPLPCLASPVCDCTCRQGRRTAVRPGGPVPVLPARAIQPTLRGKSESCVPVQQRDMMPLVFTW